LNGVLTRKAQVGGERTDQSYLLRLPRFHWSRTRPSVLRLTYRPTLGIPRMH
jgi:hypothetical protein